MGRSERSCRNEVVVALANVFVSYRRGTDSARALLLVNAIKGSHPESASLAEHQRALDVYHDVSEPAGANWPERIRVALGEADIVLVVIGPGWLATSDEYHRRRIDQADDWVHQELATALAGAAAIIPVVFDDATMPSPNALPEPLRGLSERSAVMVRTDYFDRDIQPVLEAVRATADTDGRSTPHEPGSSGWPYPDPPLKVLPTALSDEEVATAVREMVPNWYIEESPLPEDPARTRVEIKRELTFESFPDVLRFMTEIGEHCAVVNHHPRWENIYRTLWVSLSTWDIGLRVANGDLSLAAHFDRVYERYTTAE